MTNTSYSREELITSYNMLVAGIDDEATEDQTRKYGGVIRAAKGKLVEEMATHIIRLSWNEISYEPSRLTFGDVKSIKVPIQMEYVESLPKELQQYINERLEEYFFRAKVDRHIFIDGEFVFGIECKSYTENAMIKRILVDFRLLKSQYPNIVCCLLQLESQLGGSYSDPLSLPQLGSASTHTLMSFFPEVDLDVITLLDGERKVHKPIHDRDHVKTLKHENLEHAINRFKELLNRFV